MIEPATPENEDDRVAKLRALNVLDTPPEQVFDDIAPRSDPTPEQLDALAALARIAAEALAARARK